MSVSEESPVAIQQPPTVNERKPSRVGKANAEVMLREEIRAIRELWMRILQWGITVITGSQTIVFYARRSIREDMVQAKVLKVGDPIQLKIYLIGTAFLLLLAYIFYKLSDTAGQRYRVYVGQLPQLNASGIVEPTPTGRSVWLSWVFFLFPAFDLLLRLYNYELGFSP